MPSQVLDQFFFDSIFPQIEEVGQHIIEHTKTGMLMIQIPKDITQHRVDGNIPENLLNTTYYIGLHPVTNAQYGHFVGDTNHRSPSQTDFGESVWKHGEFSPKKADHPVVCVNKYDALAYCSWAGLQLPSASVWERAGGRQDNRDYPWGREWNPEKCRNDNNKGNETTASVWEYGLGGSPYGAIQLSGNVWEWCNDGLRGGSWRVSNPEFFTLYQHRLSDPTLRYDRDGFRCMLLVSDSI